MTFLALLFKALPSLHHQHSPLTSTKNSEGHPPPARARGSEGKPGCVLCRPQRRGSLWRARRRGQKDPVCSQAILGITDLS